MQPSLTPVAVERYWQGVIEHDTSGIASLLTDDFVEEWPQSGEHSVMESSGERIRRIAQYFRAPFSAADWRERITERM